MKIPNELTPLAYKLSKKVFESKLTFKEGQQQLVGADQMNSNSAADYINDFRCLIEGKRFTRTLNAFSMEYFIENIYNDFGSNGLSNALSALKQHFEYYEELQNITMHKTRAIYNKYLAFSIESPDEQEQDEIIKTLTRQNKNKQEILEELINLKLTDPAVVTINTKSFKRDNRTIAQIKMLRNFKCQICSTSIKKKDGTFYIEAAHIKPKFQKGRETLDNILLLCPNHHKEFDYGDREIIKHNKKQIHFKLNGQEYKISLEINN